MQRHGGCNRAWHLEPAGHLKLQTPIAYRGLPVFSLGFGPHQTGPRALAVAPASWGNPPSPGYSLGLCRFPRAAIFSNAKHDGAFLASASSLENCFQISIAVGFQQHPNGLPQARQPWLSRTTGAKTKVGPGNALPLSRESRGPADRQGLWSVSFTLRK